MERIIIQPDWDDLLKYARQAKIEITLETQ